MPLKSIIVRRALVVSSATVTALGGSGAMTHVSAQKPVARATASGVAAGDLREFAIPSAAYGRARRIFVYTPPSYAATSAAAYDLVVTFDGPDYVKDIPLPLMLDTLIASRRIRPAVAVFVDDSSGAVRLGDLANRARFVTFVAGELIPWIRSHYNVTRDAHRSVVMGSSAGGLAAAQIAFERPNLFGKVLSSSGAFWRGNEGSNSAPFEWLAARYASTPKRDIELFMDVGSLETIATLGGSGPVFIEATRRFRDVLQKQGYRVLYTEVPGGRHEAGTWGPRTPIGLIALLGH